MRDKKTNILCIFGVFSQALIYFKYLDRVLDINLKLIVISNDEKEYNLFLNNIRQRGMFYMPPLINTQNIILPNGILNHKLSQRGTEFIKYLKSISYDFDFSPDIIFYGQNGIINHTIKDLFPSNPKLIMYAEWFSVTDLAQRKEWPLPQKNKFIQDEWNEKSTNDAEFCDAIIVPSKYARSLWPKEYQHKVHDIFEGVDTEYLSHERIASLSKFGENLKKLHPGKKIVAYSARSIESTRGFDLWIKAYVELRKKRDDIHFVVLGRNIASQAGGGGASNNGIDDFKKWSLDQYNLKEEEIKDITWLEPLSIYDYLSLLASFDLIIYPTIGMFSNWGFYMSMYMKVPIIASNSSYFPEIIDDGTNGFLSDPYDTDEIVKKALDILNDKDYAKSIGENSYRTIMNRFTAKNSNKKFIQLVDKLCGLNSVGKADDQITKTVESYYNFDKTIKSKFGFYIVVDDHRVKHIASLIEFLSTIKKLDKNIAVYIGVKTTDNIFFKILDRYSNEKIIIKRFLPNNLDSVIINVLIQGNLSEFNIIANSAIKIKDVELMKRHIGDKAANNQEFIGSILRDFSSINEKSIPKNRLLFEDYINKYDLRLTSSIVVVPHKVFEKIGYFNEKLSIEAVMVDYSLRASFYNIKFYDLANKFFFFKNDLDNLSIKYNARTYQSHGYTVNYENFFRKNRENIKNILYIGSYQYIESVKMFLEYFPSSHIYLCTNKNLESFERCTMVNVDQKNRESIIDFLNNIDEDVSFDIVIDNGGHTMIETQTSLGVLFPYVKSGGVYIIESMHVCPETNGKFVNGYIKSNELTTLKLAKMISNEMFNDINMSYCTNAELQYIIKNHDFCNIEMGSVSEIIFIGKKEVNKQALISKESGDLYFLAKKYKTDKLNHNYIGFYEKYLRERRENVTKVLEIGVHNGSSHKMWAEYFPNAKIYGIDIFDKTQYDSENITTHIADQANRIELGDFIEKYGGDFDVIIDDGGHTMKQNQITLGFLFKYLKKDGVFIIEDLHTSPDTSGKFHGDVCYGVEVVEGEEISALSMLRMISNKKINDIERTFITIDELDYLEKNIEFCNIEMGKISEIAFLKHK